MTTHQETLTAATNFRDRVNANKKVRKLLKRWSPTIHFETRDDDFKLTMVMSGGEVSSVEQGLTGEEDLVVIFPSLEDLANMFSGKLDPTPKYLSGDILVKGHQADVIKLDAITMIIWPEN